MGLWWRSVTTSLTVLCLASASDVVVVSGATDRTGSLIYKALKEQNVNVRGFIRKASFGTSRRPARGWDMLPAMLRKATLLVT